MKTKLSLVAIASSTAIASSILLGSVSSAQPCSLRSAYYRERYEQPSWLRSPLAAVITLPGIALAAALYLGGRSYQR